MAQPELEQIVQRMIDAGESEDNIAAVIKGCAPPAAPARRTWTDTAVDALPSIGGAIGGIAGGLGGTAFGMGVGGAPGAIGGAALGGAAGESARQLIERGRGRLTTASPTQAASDIASAGAIQGGAEATGGAVGAGLRLVGRGLYRAGALPLVEFFDKYGDVIKTGIQNRIPATKAGVEKATALAASRKAVKDAAVDAAGNRVSFPTQAITGDALARVQGAATRTAKAGYPDPMPEFIDRARRMEVANGPGLTPRALEDIKHTVDDQLGPAYKKLRKREALTPNERMDMELSQAAGDAQASVIPNYRAMNKATMDAEGLARALRRRSIGQNQGLENAATAAAMSAIGPAALVPRVAMIPGVATNLGIATHMLGERPAIPANALRAALATLMSSHQQPEDESR